jgi:hypothetical protein
MYIRQTMIGPLNASNLGPLSDIDSHHATGEEIVEVDVGRRFWFPGDRVVLRRNAEGYTDVWGDWADRL